MKFDGLNTPVYVKTEKEFPWPGDKMFYLLTRDGLFVGRNHEWFKSLAPATRGPGELEGQQAFCKLSYPRIPRALLERAVGFFHHIYEMDHWESALILVWNRQANQMELLCPDQTCSWGEVKYEIPKDLPPHLLVIGDLHAHGNGSPKPSWTDEHDELARPGIHLIVGGINTEPPELWCAVVVDGQRFDVTDAWSMIEDYIQRDKEFPKEWLAKVKEKKWETPVGGNYYGGGYGSYLDIPPDKNDKRIMKEILARYRLHPQCPTLYELRSELFTRTHHMTYLHCERKAQKFIDNWGKMPHKLEDDHEYAA